MKLRSLILTDGQRKFAGEVAIIVLGVLIALGIGEFADSVRWSYRVSSSLDAIRVELENARGNVRNRIASQACIERRIAEVGIILRKARQTHSLPDVGAIGGPPNHLIVNSAFEVAKSEGVLLHMDRSKAMDLAVTYTLVTDAYLNLTEQEHKSWRTLRLLEGAPGKIDGDLLTLLLQAWADARELSTILGMVAQGSDEQLGKAGIAIPKGTFIGGSTIGEAREGSRCPDLIVDRKPFASAPKT